MRIIGLLLAATLAVGCGISDLGGGGDPLDEGAADGYGLSDPLAMPPAIIKYLSVHGWGQMHLQWHTTRQWDRMQASDLTWAKRQGWTRNPVQEGQHGNGLEFLAMHRMMMQMIEMDYPTSKKYFVGWATPPTNPRDRADPLPGGATTPFDDNMLMAIGRLETDLASFKTDDELGLYIETSLVWSKTKPNARSTDPTAGIHNYIHNRFADPHSKIDIGDPTVNLQNKRFWRLHGFIDAVWKKYRALKGLTESDPVYDAAMKKAMADMPSNPKGTTLGGADPDPPPDTLTKWFENNP